MRPGLSLLCITKDEAPRLMRMLRSVQGVVDDIVVFDTGSKDLSPGVARLFGARVFEIEWPGSFSEALNLALKEVQTEWTLRLDTDEWLPTESGPKIRQLMSESGAMGFYLIRRDLSDETHYSESWMLRMWRTHPALRFEGFIHEYFSDETLSRASGGRKLFRAPIPFLHDGFLGGMSPARHKRNVELLRKELVARPGQLYYEAELAQTLLLLGEPEGVDRLNGLVDRVLESGERPEPFVANLLGTVLSRAKKEDLDSDRIREVLDRSWEWFDASPPMLWAIAQAEHRRDNAEGTYRALLKLEELSETGGYEREWTFDGRILGEALWHTLAQVADSLGRSEVAARNRERIRAAATSDSHPPPSGSAAGPG